MDDWVRVLKAMILRKAKSTGPGFDLTPSTIQNCAAKTGSIEKPFENFLGTGNLPSQSGLGLMQNKGLTIMAENINRTRYMSHFRAIHRGSFFQEMRTTEVRALLPDAWGFICPVHTPDGSPCGLLNHLTMSVKVATHQDDPSQIPQLLVDLGMCPFENVNSLLNKGVPVLHVMLNGKLLGYVVEKDAKILADKLRMLKVSSDDRRVPQLTEICLIP